jgi:hypothetical protein
VHEPCQDFRDRWLEGALTPEPPTGAESHAAACEACADWVQRRRAQVGVLTSLERLRLPEHLEGVLREELQRTVALSPLEEEPRSPRCEFLLRAMPHLSAPPELAQRVGRILGGDQAAAESDRSPAARSLLTLDPSPVPSVLDRLVEEELAAPSAHRVERFVGNLEPRRAPVELTLRLERSLRRRRRSLLAGAGTLLAAAAGLVLWILLEGRPEGDSPTRRLNVIRVDAQADIAPVAAGLAASLNGGWTPGNSGVRGEEQG